MKKLFCLILAVVLMMGLGVTAAAADEEHVHEIPASGPNVQIEYTGKLDGEWLGTTYGFVKLNDDGTFVYKIDKENKLVEKAFETDRYLFDRFIITMNTTNGGWFGRNVNIGIAPDGVKIPKLEVLFTLTDLDGTTEGSVLWPLEVCEEIALRTEYGRLALTDDGYVYTHYPWLNVSRNLLKNVRDEQTIPVMSAGGEVTDVVLRIIGVDDFPGLKNITLKLADGVNSCGGNVLKGAVLGDGNDYQHKFKWGTTEAKYGTLTPNDDGTFTYEFTGTRSETTTYVETFDYTYTDLDGDKATGVLTIKILPAEEDTSSDPPTTGF